MVDPEILKPMECIGFHVFFAQMKGLTQGFDPFQGLHQVEYSACAGYPIEKPKTTMNHESIFNSLFIIIFANIGISIATVNVCTSTQLVKNLNLNTTFPKGGKSKSAERMLSMKR